MKRKHEDTVLEETYKKLKTNVDIFWDLHTCPVEIKDIEFVANSIRSVAKEYGNGAYINLYADQKIHKDIIPHISSWCSKIYYCGDLDTAEKIDSYVDELLDSSNTMIIITGRRSLSITMDKITIQGVRLVFIYPVKADPEFIADRSINICHKWEDFFPKISAVSKEKKKRIVVLKPKLDAKNIQIPPGVIECKYFFDGECQWADKCKFLHKCRRCWKISKASICTWCPKDLCPHSYFCREGIKCKDKHTDKEIEVFNKNDGRSAMNLYTSKCSSFYGGKCPNGRNCTYIHNDMKKMHCYLCLTRNDHIATECPYFLTWLC